MKLLSKLLLASILLLGTGYAYAKPNTTISSKSIKTEDRHLSGFNAVNLVGSYDVYIIQGATESVIVKAPDNVIGNIVTEVQNGVLKIYNKHNSGFHWGWNNGNNKMVIYVSVKDINSISVTGSGDVYFKEGINTNSLKLIVAGSGDIYGKVNVKSLESSVSGSGDIKISGSAENSTVKVVGSGDFVGGNLLTVNTQVKVVGSGDAKVNASNKIDASVAGSGDIRYTGAAKSVSTSKSGSGDIERY